MPNRPLRLESWAYYAIFFSLFVYSILFCRRRNESASSVSNEDVVRKTTTPYSMSSAEATPTAVAVASPFQYPAAVTAATVTNAAYLPPHLIRSYGSFPANSYIRSPYPAVFTPGAELIYPHHHHHHHHQHHQRQYPPPPPPASAATTFLPGPIHYSTLVPPKLSCYNCGSQSHLANDCPESMLEEASKQGNWLRGSSFLRIRGLVADHGGNNFLLRRFI